MNSPQPPPFNFSHFSTGKPTAPGKFIPMTPAVSKAISRFSHKQFTSPSPGVKETLSDRFIPVRACANLFERFLAEDTPQTEATSQKKNQPCSEIGMPQPFNLSNEPSEFHTEDMSIDNNEDSKNAENHSSKVYAELLKTHIFSKELEDTPKKNENELFVHDENTTLNSGTKENRSLLSFKKEYKCGNTFWSESPIIKVGEEIPMSQTISEIRKIPTSPYKILDAPGLKDDYYLNILDWSNTDILAVALNNQLFSLKSNLSIVETSLQLERETEICSISFNKKGNMLALGLNYGFTHLFDVHTNKIIHTFKGHYDKVTCASWCNDSIFSTGSRDRLIYDHDLRVKSDYIRKHEGHKQEICSIKWDCLEKNLASGGNDNRVMLWNLYEDKHTVIYNEHRAAVKALAWSQQNPHILATGGGTADRTIRLWDTVEGKCMKNAETGSQVCNLMFSKNTNELISTHGYSSNLVMLWKTAGSLQKIGQMSGHTNRVLQLGISPDGENIVTGAGDETLRFWNLFPKIAKKTEIESSLFPSFMEVR